MSKFFNSVQESQEENFKETFKEREQKRSQDLTVLCKVFTETRSFREWAKFAEKCKSDIDWGRFWNMIHKSNATFDCEEPFVKYLKDGSVIC